jgi:hypothetical protein
MTQTPCYVDSPSLTLLSVNRIQAYNCLKALRINISCAKICRENPGKIVHIPNTDCGIITRNYVCT